MHTTRQGYLARVSKDVQPDDEAARALLVGHHGLLVGAEGVAVEWRLPRVREGCGPCLATSQAHPRSLLHIAEKDVKHPPKNNHEKLAVHDQRAFRPAGV